MKKLLCAVWLASVALSPLAVAAQEKPVVEDVEDEIDPVIITVTEAANLRALADKAGYDGRAEASYAFVVPKGQNILGKPGGGTAIDTGLWPEGAFIALIVNGNVYGGGGNGADGGDTPMMRDGGRGGDAVTVRAPLAIAVSATGSIKGGGGGGAGANDIGSGGGGGFPNGKGGEGGNTFSNAEDGVIMTTARGSYGTIGGGGKGGQRGAVGGDGGNAAMPGQSLSRIGGGEGFAIRTNGQVVTVDNKGQIYGQTG